MNHIRILLALAALGFCASASAQERFQGSVRYDVQSPQMNGGMTLHFSYPNVRMDMELMGTATSIIQPVSGGGMTLLLHDARAWMNLPAGTFGLLGVRAHNRQPERAQTGATPLCANCPMESNATGQTRTILGQLCRQYLIPETGGDTLEVWATSGLGGFDDFVPGMAPDPGLDMALSRALFPLMMKRTSASGQVTTLITATELTTTPVDPAIMRPPADYQMMSADLFGDGALGQ